MIRSGRRSPRLRAASESDGRGEMCFWCHRPAPDSFYRSPIVDIPGGRLIVCGPECPERPNGTRVFSIAADWASPKEIA